MKVRELQAGSEMPSGEEDRSSEMTSKPDVTGHQKKKEILSRDEPKKSTSIKLNFNQLCK